MFADVTGRDDYSRLVKTDSDFQELGGCPQGDPPFAGHTDAEIPRQTLVKSACA